MHIRAHFFEGFGGGKDILFPLNEDIGVLDR